MIVDHEEPVVEMPGPDTQNEEMMAVAKNALVFMDRARPSAITAMGRNEVMAYVYCCEVLEKISVGDLIVKAKQ